MSPRPTHDADVFLKRDDYQRAKGCRIYDHQNPRRNRSDDEGTRSFETAALDGKRAREGDRGAAQPDHGDSEG